MGTVHFNTTAYNDDYPKFLEDCVFKNISVEQAKTDYKKALDFIEYVLENLEDGNFGKAIRLIVAKRSLGWDSDRKKISDLLPDHHVDCFMGN
jgi:N-glycosylase/DNA lyase